MLNSFISFLAVTRSIKISPDFFERGKLNTSAGLFLPRYALLSFLEKTLSTKTRDSSNSFPSTEFFRRVKGIENLPRFDEAPDFFIYLRRANLLTSTIFPSFISSLVTSFLFMWATVLARLVFLEGTRRV